MSLFTPKPLIALLATAALLTACGGSGSSAPPPVGGLNVDAGEGGVTLTWTPVTGVDYWAYTGQTSTICKNCATNDWKSTVGAQSRGWDPKITSPYFFTGTTIPTSLNNDALYSFIMDGRINDGPGGDATASRSATPRLNGEYWYAGAIGTAGITSLAFGPVLNTTTNTYATTGTYLGLGTGGIKYKSIDGLTWTPVTTATDTANWKSAAYAFPGTQIQKFVGVGASGAVVYSSDLVTFTSATSGSQDLNAVASGANMVVAVGNNGTILRSSDGINWSSAASVPSTPHLYAVSYTNLATGGLWMAVGAEGKVFFSYDASTWTAFTSNPTTSQDLKGIAALVNTTYPNGIYSPLVAPTYSYSVVAVGNGGTVIQTVDGINWTAQTLGSGVNLNAIVASSALIPTNQFMVVGDGGKAYTSPNGVTWTPRTTTSTQNLTGLNRGYNNQYLAWAANGTTTYSK